MNLFNAEFEVMLVFPYLGICVLLLMNDLSGNERAACRDRGAAGHVHGTENRIVDGLRQAARRDPRARPAYRPTYEEVLLLCCYGISC